MSNTIAVVGVRATIEGLAGFRAGMGTIRREAALAGAGAGLLTRGFAGAGSGASGLSASLATLGQNIRLVGGAFRTFGNEISNVGLRLSAFVSVPIVAAFAGVLESAREFEVEMTKIATQVGIVDERFEQWRDTLLDIAPALGVAPAQLARGLFAVTSGGIRDSQAAIDATIAAAKLAAVGLGDIFDIAKLTTAALLQFADSGLTAEDAANQLLVAVREGQFPAERLAGSFGRVIAIADELNVSLAESLAFVAAFTRTGVSAEVAVTSLRSTLTALLKPTEDAKKALLENSLSVDALKDSIAERGLAATLVYLREVLSDVDFARVFGQARALAGVLAVTGDLGPAFNDIANNVTNSAGAIEEAFGIVQETFDFQISAARSSLQALGVTIGETLLPYVNRFLRQLVDLAQRVRAFAAANPELTAFVLQFSALVAVIGPVLFLIGAFISTIGTAIGTLGTAVTLLGVFSSSLGAVAVPLAIAAGLVTAFAATTIAAFGRIRDNLGDEFDAIVRDAVDWGRNVIVSFANGLISAVGYVVQALAFIAGVIADLLQPGSPPKILPDLVEWGAGAMQSYLDGWTTADFSVFNDIARTITGYIQSFGDLGDNVDGMTIAERVIGARSSIQQAINEFATIGAVTERTLAAIARAVGRNEEQVRNYVLAMIALERVSRAIESIQREINDITREYNQLLAPIEGRLAEITAQQQEWARADRRIELEQIISDPTAPVEAIERALLELEQLDLLDEQAGLESQRDALLAPLQLRLEALQAEREILQEQADVLEQQLALQAEQRNLLQEVASAVDRLAAGLRGAKEDAEELGRSFESTVRKAEKLPKPVRAIRQEFKEIVDSLGLTGAVITSASGFDPFAGADDPNDPLGIFASIDGAYGDIDLGELIEFEPIDFGLDIGGFTTAISEDLTPALTTLSTNLDTFAQNVASAVLAIRGETPGLEADAGFFDRLFGRGESSFFSPDFLAEILPILADILEAYRRISSVFDKFAGAAGKQFAKAWDEVSSAIGGSIPSFSFLQFVLKILLTVVEAVVSVFGLLVLGLIIFGGVVARTVGGAIAGFIRGITYVRQALEIFFAGILMALGGIAKFISGVFTLDLEKALEGVKDFFLGILLALAGLLATIITIVVTAITTVVGLVSGFYNGVMEIFWDLFNALVGNSVWPDMFTKMEQIATRWIKDTIKSFKQWVSDMLTGEESVFGRFVLLMTKLWEGLVEAIVGEDGILYGMQDAIRTLFEGLGAVIEGAVDTWIAPFLDKMANFGRDLIAAIVGGMDEGSRGLKNQGADTVDEAKQGAENKAEIESPSRVFMEIGNQMVMGLIAGMQQLDSAIAANAANMVVTSAQSMSSVIPQTAGSASNTNVSSTFNINNGMDAAAAVAVWKREVRRSLG